MRVIGLTGSLGTGKSTVAKMFGKLGAKIIDAADHAFTHRRGQRVDIAACRALGTLATDAPPEQMPAVAGFLIERSGDQSAHVAMAALDAHVLRDTSH